MECAREMNCFSFGTASNLQVAHWLVRHKLMDATCNIAGCQETNCEVVNNGDGRVGLRCPSCHHISRGGLRGFFSNSRLGFVKTLLLMFAIVSGISRKNLKIMTGLHFNKNTYTKYILDVSQICAEALERNRRAEKFLLAQIDETAFGKRKYHVGRRRRNAGAQWGLTIVKVCPITGKTLRVDLVFLPDNKRGVAQLAPIIMNRMAPGGEIHTDCWRAYPECAARAECTHKTVNHSEHFRDPDSGVHTNNVEGIHGVLKRAAMAQFGRLPYLPSDGLPYYLDLLIWRINAELKGERTPWQQFCFDLWVWTNQPELEGFNRRVPMPGGGEEEEQEVEEEEDDIDDVGGDMDGDWFMDIEGEEEDMEEEV